MADDRDLSQQTEEPSQRRLDEAQAHGDIVKSQEVTTFLVLAGGALAVAIFGSSTAEGFVRTFRMFLEQPDQMIVDSGAAVGLMHGVLLRAAELFGPVLGFLAAVTLGGHVLQHRPIFAPERLLP